MRRFPREVLVEIVEPGEMIAQDEAALAMLVAGRGSLSSVLGDESTRRRLFSGHVNWQRVFIARINGVTVGFLAFQWEGDGPYRSIRLADFFREFGVLSGWWRGWVHHFLEWRTRTFGLYIYGLKVVTQARRRGVARALIMAAEVYARNIGASTLELEVLEENTKAKAFYASLGFETAVARDSGWFRRFLGVGRVLHLKKHLIPDSVL